MVWHSHIHKTEQILKFSESKEPDEKKQNSIDSNILTTLLGGKNTDNKMNSIIKSITTNKKNFNKNSYRKNHWVQSDICLKFNDKNKIIFDSNSFANSLMEELNGVALYIKYKNDIIIIQGYLQDDVLSIMQDHPLIKTKLESIKKYINYNNITVSTQFRNNFLNILSMKDILTATPVNISVKLKAQYEDFQNLITKPLLVLVNDFLLASKTRKKDILLCLLLSDKENKKLAAVLFDTLKQQSKTNLAEQLYLGLPVSLRSELDNEIIKQEESEEKLSKITESDISYEKRISLLDVDDMVKSKAMENLNL